MSAYYPAGDPVPVAVAVAAPAGTSAPVVPLSAVDAVRVRNNEQAWQNLSGYVTSSGYPCWDRTVNVCIPKGFGFGYTINCWALCCCFLCHTPEVSTYRPTRRVWVFWLLIVMGAAIGAFGVVMAFYLSQHCDGYHSGSSYFDFECPGNATSADSSPQVVCCQLQCSSPGNTCFSLADLGSGVVEGSGIMLVVIGFLFVVPGIAALNQNARALRQQERNASLLPQGRPVKYME
jgi:hypothetical protein